MNTHGLRERDTREGERERYRKRKYCLDTNECLLYLLDELTLYHYQMFSLS